MPLLHASEWNPTPITHTCARARQSSTAPPLNLGFYNGFNYLFKQSEIYHFIDRIGLHLNAVLSL